MMLRLIIFLLIPGLFTVQAQQMQRLEVEHVDSGQPLPQRFLEPEVFPDTITMAMGIRKRLEEVKLEGFLLATIDSIRSSGNNHTAYLVSGELFQWHIISTNIEQNILRQLGIDKVNSGQSIPYDQLPVIKRKLIEYYENNGHPFARVFIDDISIAGQLISGRLVCEPMEFITFEPLNLTGDVQLNEAFLANHTGIRQGQPFSQRTAAVASSTVADLPFLRITGESALVFSGYQAQLSVPVEPRRANRFDGIIGLSGEGTETDPYRLNGLLNLLLINALERGETFGVKWQGIGNGTQRLELNARYPYLFSTPLITGLLFSLHKQDTSYISLRRKPYFAYNAGNNFLITAFADIRSTDLLNTSQHSQGSIASDLMDTRITFYGMEFLKQSPGFINSFRTGNSLELSFGAGNRIIKVNTAFDPEVYDNLVMRQSQLTVSLNTIVRHPLSDNFSIVSHIESSGLFGKQLFENELFRIGGFNSLKGFDEESIYASSFGILTNELRYFTGEMSFVSFIMNVAWYEKNIEQSYQSGWPFGMGAGISLATAPGILSIYYAIGKLPDSPLTFRNAKIHFGFISLF